MWIKSACYNEVKTLPLRSDLFYLRLYNNWFPWQTFPGCVQYSSSLLNENISFFDAAFTSFPRDSFLVQFSWFSLPSSVFLVQWPTQLLYWLFLYCFYASTYISFTLPVASPSAESAVLMLFIMIPITQHIWYNLKINHLPI